MTKSSLLLFSLLLVLESFSQDQKLAKFLGTDFKLISARKSIPYKEPGSGYQAIPSTTINHDTSGLVYRNEYLLFRNYDYTQKTTASYLKTTYVSNAEYQEFQNWVRDSNAREKIYSRLKPDEEALKYIETNGKEIRERQGSKFILDRDERRHPFNWKKQLNYSDPMLMPILADMYLPPAERFYGKKYFDKRKFTYHYCFPLAGNKELLRLYTNLIDHPAFWAGKSVSLNDEFAVLGQTYDRLLPGSPVIGLTGAQAHAFCHWKEIQLQQKLDQQQIPYRVRVTLPMISELTEIRGSLTVPEKNYSAQWKISVRDYREFVEAVRDSVLTEALYAELSLTSPEAAAKLLRHQPEYFDEYYLVYKKFDPKDLTMNREYFPLNPDKGLLKKYPAQLKAIESRLVEKTGLFVYFRMDIAEKSIAGNAEVWKRLESEYHYHEPEELEIMEINDLTGEPVGMDHSLEQMNLLNHGSGVRDHSNYARFILRDSVRVTPGISLENQNPEDAVKGITYQQALAYYHWKYPVWNASLNDNWQRYVYPSEEQFNRVQNGQQLVIPQHELNFPSPVFRYVVSFSKQ